MRILQVVHGFPPREWAGTELVTFHLSQALQARGHDITVMTRTGEDQEEFSVHEAQENGLHIVRVVNNLTKVESFRQSYDNAFLDERFTQLLDRVQPDLVHFQHLALLSVSLLPLAVALGYPTILSLHDFFFPCHLIHLIDTQGQFCLGPERGERCVSCLQSGATPEEIRRRFVRMEEVLRASDAIITPSVFLARKIQQYFPIVEEKLRPVPLGVSRFPPVERTRSANGRLRILFVGILLPHKGAHVLVEALHGLPADAIEVSLYGATLPFWQSYVDRLKEQAYGLPVRFCGVYPHEQLSAILAQHDVLVMPMIWEETFSILAREALLAGLPVIAVRRGALPEVIQDGVNGLLFEPEDALDLRRCLSRLLTEPELIDQLRVVNPQIKTVEEYARDMEGVYQEVTIEPRRSRLLRQQLTKQQQSSLALQEAFGAERDRYEAACRQIAHERTQAQITVEKLHRLLGEREAQLRARDARLEVIYGSTTWRLYRTYEKWVLTPVAYLLALLRRIVGKGRRWGLVLQPHPDSWLAPEELGSCIPPYRPTFGKQDFINDRHRFFSFCPVKDVHCVDIGIPGWLRREDALKLYEIAYFADGHILELGTYQGLSTAILAQAVQDAGEGRTITSIEHDPAAMAEAERHLADNGVKAVVQLICAEAVSYCRELIANRHTFALVFVDHSHTYQAVSEICRLLPLLVPSGGFCLFHDFNDVRNNDAHDPEYGVSSAVHDTLDPTLFAFYGIYGCSALYRKTA